MTPLSFESCTLERKINALALKIYMRKTFVDNCSTRLN